MKRKLSIILIVLIVALVAVIPVSAGRGNGALGRFNKPCR